LLKGIIFDFDGVIAESVNIKTAAFVKMYEKYGDDVVRKVASHHISHGGISRFEKFKLYHRDFLGIQLTNQQLKDLAYKFSKLVVQKVVNAPYVPGALEFVKEHHKDYQFFISTGTPQDEITNIIQKKKLKIYFESIYGSPREKTDHIGTIIEKYKFLKDEVVFIGDSESDYNAAKTMKIKFVLRNTQSSKNISLNKKVKRIDNLFQFSNILTQLYEKN